MKIVTIDRTRELEVRLKAIRILPEDTCVFFQQREGCIMGFNQCRYCRFAKFDLEENTNEESGFCKFKK